MDSITQKARLAYDEEVQKLLQQATKPKIQSFETIGLPEKLKTFMDLLYYPGPMDSSDWVKMSPQLVLCNIDELQKMAQPLINNASLVPHMCLVDLESKYNGVYASHQEQFQGRVHYLFGNGNGVSDIVIHSPTKLERVIILADQFEVARAKEITTIKDEEKLFEYSFAHFLAFPHVLPRSASFVKLTVQVEPKNVPVTITCKKVLFAWDLVKLLPVSMALQTENPNQWLILAEQAVLVDSDMNTCNGAIEGSFDEAIERWQKAEQEEKERTEQLHKERLQNAEKQKWSAFERERNILLQQPLPKEQIQTFELDKMFSLPEKVKTLMGFLPHRGSLDGFDWVKMSPQLVLCNIDEFQKLARPLSDAFSAPLMCFVALESKYNGVYVSHQEQFRGRLNSLFDMYDAVSDLVIRSPIKLNKVTINAANLEVARAQENKTINHEEKWFEYSFAHRWSFPHWLPKSTFFYVQLTVEVEPKNIPVTLSCKKMLLDSSNVNLVPVNVALQVDTSPNQWLVLAEHGVIIDLDKNLLEGFLGEGPLDELIERWQKARR